MRAQRRAAPGSRLPAATRLVAGRYHLRGYVLPDGGLRDVYAADGRITFEPVRGAETLVEGGWLVPGLVDGHAHLALASPAGPSASAQERVEASARAQLAAGVLLVREPGGPDHTSTLVGPGRDLPRTVTAGRFLAPPGGYFPGLAREVPPDLLATAVTEEAAAGSGWVKLIGDFLDDSGRLVPNWEPAVLAEATAAAHAAGVRITIHAVMPEAIVAAVEAGVDAIEHGSGVPRDLLPVLAGRGITWVPTLLISDGIRDWSRTGMARGTRLAVYSWLDALPGTVAAAARAGVRLLAGTDAGMVPHGMVAAEVDQLVRAGVPTDSAVAAASWEARRYLGLPGIVEGAPADIVALPDDPAATRTYSLGTASRSSTAASWSQPAWPAAARSTVPDRSRVRHSAASGACQAARELVDAVDTGVSGGRSHMTSRCGLWTFRSNGHGC